jgi:hypothetical protein
MASGVRQPSEVRIGNVIGAEIIRLFKVILPTFSGENRVGNFLFIDASIFIV